jgi:integrase
MGRKGKKGTFPFSHEKNGRCGKIYKIGDGRFKTHFKFGGENHQKIFSSFEKALEHLNHEFSTLDTNVAESESQYPLDRDRKHYYELEQRLKMESETASLWVAVDFYIANHKKKKLVTHTVQECMDKFIASRLANGASIAQVKNLKKHCRRFSKSFGSRKIHEIDTSEIEKWLLEQRDERKNEPWEPKTRRNYRGSLVDMANYAQRVLKAIPDTGGETEFQKVPAPKIPPKREVEVFNPEDLEKLLVTALEQDVDFIPMIVLGGLLGLRPNECHGEESKRRRIQWEDFHWEDNYLAVWGQKVNSKATRHVPIPENATLWLEPFKVLKGNLWNHKSAYDDRFKKIRHLAGVSDVYNGLRHSYASFRYRKVKDPAQMALEMGNSREEFFRSYRRNVTDADADRWFGVKPPNGYSSTIQSVLASRNAP